MLYISILDAKEGTDLAEIDRQREIWFKEGLDEAFQRKCKSITRYESVGGSPVKVFFAIETDDPTAIQLLSRHFGDSWDVVTYPVVERELAKAYEEDREILSKASSMQLE